MRSHRDWACSACTFLNKPNKRSCEMCSTARMREDPEEEEEEQEEPEKQEKQTQKQMQRQKEKEKEKEKEKQKQKEKRDVLWDSESDEEVIEVVEPARIRLKKKRSREDKGLFLVPAKPSKQGKINFQPASSSADQSRKRRKTEIHLRYPSTGPTISNEQQLLWVDKYAPKTAAGLCVHKKRVEEVRQWLSSAFSWQPQLRSPQPKLLILCGPPGIGKSTMVRVLAQEAGASVRCWQDTSQSGMRAWRPVRATGASDFQILGDGRTEHQSQQQDFSEFLNRSSRYSSLALHSTDVPSGPPSPSAARAGKKHMILIESLPWQGNRTAQAAFHCTLHRFLVARCVHPAVLIFSECAEKQVNPTVMARIFSAEVMHDAGVRSLSCNIVPAGMMKKLLQAILQKEGVSRRGELLESAVASSNGDLRHAINSVQFFQTPLKQSPNDFPELNPSGATKARKGRADSKAGAKRARSHTLQSKDLGSSSSSSSGSSGSSSSSGGRVGCGHDRFMSELHAIGKVLRAKRADGEVSKEGDAEKAGSSAAGNRARERAPLTFVPEEVVGKTTMGVSVVADFLLENCVKFCGQDYVEEASEMMDYLSDTAVLGGKFRPGQDSVFPDQYVGSLASRAVAHANRHPARGFHAIRKPSAYAARTTARERRLLLADAYTRTIAATARAGLRRGGGVVSGCGHDCLATEIVPFQHLIDRAQNQSIAGPQSDCYLYRSLVRDMCRYDGSSNGRFNTRFDTGSRQPAHQATSSNSHVSKEIVSTPLEEEDEEEEEEIEEFDD